MKSNIVIFLTAAVLTLQLSCASVKKITIQKPHAQQMTKIYYPADHLKIFKKNAAHLPSLSNQLIPVKSISVRYALSEKKNPEISVWQRELEQYFLKQGISLNEEDAIEDIPLLDKKAENTSDASLIIDQIKIYEMNDTCIISLDSHNNAKYPFTYYIASISGKLLMKNHVLVWSSSVTASTFQTLQSIKPHVKMSAQKNYRFSDKIKKWIGDSWSYTFTDNFQNLYNDTYKKDFHKADLIRFIVKEFVDTLKK